MITSLAIADYRRHLLSHKKKLATVNNGLDILQAQFGWALSARDVHRAEKRNLALIELLLHTRLRLGQACSLADGRRLA